MLQDGERALESAGGGEAIFVRRGAKKRPQRQKTGGAMWSEQAEEQFFDLLAATANVTLACGETGFTTPTVYRLRRMRPDFAARWQAALACGYARLEMTLVETANASLDATEFDETRAIPKMTVEQAMNVLRAHRNEIAGGRGGPGRQARRRTLAEVRDSIVRKIEAIERAEREERAESGAIGAPGGDAPQRDDMGDNHARQ